MCRVLLVLGLVLAVGSTALADEPDLPLKDFDKVYIQRGTKDRDDLIAEWTAEIAKLKKENMAIAADPSYSKDEKETNLEANRRKIDELEARRERLKARPYLIPTMPISKLAVGQVGQLAIDEESGDPPLVYAKRNVGSVARLVRIENTDITLCIEGAVEPRFLGGPHELAGTYAIVGRRKIEGESYLYLKRYSPPIERPKKGTR